VSTALAPNALFHEALLDHIGFKLDFIAFSLSARPFKPLGLLLF